MNTSVIFWFFFYLDIYTEKSKWNYHMQDLFAVLYLSDVELRLILATSFRILPNKVRRMYLLMNIYKVTETCFCSFFMYCAFPLQSSYVDKFTHIPHEEKRLRHRKKSHQNVYLLVNESNPIFSWRFSRNFDRSSGGVVPNLNPRFWDPVYNLRDSFRFSSLNNEFQSH